MPTDGWTDRELVVYVWVYVCIRVCVWLKRRNACHLWKHGQNVKWGKSDRETKDRPTKLTEKEIKLMVTRSGGEKEELEKDGQEAVIWNYQINIICTRNVKCSMIPAANSDRWHTEKNVKRENPKRADHKENVFPLIFLFFLLYLYEKMDACWTYCDNHFPIYIK